MRGFSKRGIAAAIGLACVLFQALNLEAETPLSADEIVEKALKRAESVKNLEYKYSYTKLTVTEELDAKGKLRERREKTYEVTFDSGETSLKLIKVSGRNLSPEQLEKQNERENAERRKLMPTKSGKGDSRENFLNREVIEKYRFTLIRKTILNDRPAYELSFQPRSQNLPVNKLSDRLLNRFAGTVWVDAEEFELARADIHLQSAVSLWGGLIGSMKTCAFTLERIRHPDGVWFNSITSGWIEGRKLLDDMRIKTKSESTNFRRLVDAN